MSGVHPARGGSARGGDTEGFGAFAVAYESGDGAVVMANGAGGAQLARSMVRSIAAAYGWPDFAPHVRSRVPLDAAAMARLEGRYQYRGTAEFTISVTNSRLYITSPGDKPEEAMPASANELFVLSDDVSFVFDEGTGPATSGYIAFSPYNHLAFHRLN